MNNEGIDPVQPMVVQFIEFFNKFPNKTFAQSLYCLFPDSSLNSYQTNEELEISAHAKLSALQAFANSVPFKRQFELLRNRKLLVSFYVEESHSKLFILKQPDNIDNRVIQAVCISSNGAKIKNKYLLFEKANSDDSNFERNVEYTLPLDISSDWKIKENGYLKNVTCYYQEDYQYSLPILNDSFRQESFLNKLDILLEAFNSIKKITDIEKYLVTPFNIIKSQNKYTVFSPQYLESDYRNIGYACDINYNLRMVELPEENSHLWRIGFALAGLIGLTQEIIHFEPSKYQKESLSSLSQDEVLDRTILIQTLNVLSGLRWWSKPRKKLGNEDVNGNNKLRLPWAVENCIKRAKEYLKCSDNISKLTVWLIVRVESLLMGYSHKCNFLYAKGGFSHICSIIANNTFQADQLLLELFKSILEKKFDFSRHRRTVMIWLSMVEVVSNLNDRCENDSRATYLQSVKTILQVRAINNYFKSVSLELLKLVKSSLEDNFDTIHDDLNLLDLSDEIIYWTQSEGIYDFIEFVRLFDKKTIEASISENWTEYVTPVAWIALAWISLCSIFQKNKKTELLEISEDFIDVFEALSYSGEHQYESYPWLHTQKSTNKIDDCYNTLFNTKSDFTIKLNDLIGIRVLSIHNTKAPISLNKDSISFTAGNSEEWELSKWQVNIENLTGDDGSKFEREKDKEGKWIYFWTETWRKNRLISVSLLSESYRILMNSVLHEKTIPTEEITKDGETHDSIDYSDTINHEKYKQGIVEDTLAKFREQEPISDDKNSSITSIFPESESILGKFRDCQNVLWQGRVQRPGRHIRVAMCQLRVDESYSHPLREACSLLNELDESIEHLKKNPSKYNEKLGLNNFKGKAEIRKLVSSAEYRRRKILGEVFRVCKHLKVDLLLLPEYSVRPETVIWIHEQLTTGQYADIPLTVWSGTYRLPYWKTAREVLGKNIPSLASALHVIGPDGYSESRWKKYPAVALAELFNPYHLPLEPLFWMNSSNKGGKRIYPGDYVLELICSENFALTSPVNRHAISQAYYQLLRIFFSNYGKHSGISKDLLDKDLSNWSKWSSLSPSLEDDATEWMNYSPRRTVLFVPAFTTRASDYHLLGQANLLAAGICTVFCNAVSGKSCGNSCFIGHGSWTNRLNSNEYFDDRIGPYNGVFPGIYRRDQKFDGALGEKDQALVIADIDPVYMSEGKPRPQLLHHPLQLVAHLPIIEFSSNTSRNYKREGNCTCSKLKRESFNKSILEHVIKLLESEKNDHHPQKRVCGVLNKIADICDDPWLKKRAKAYSNYSMVKLGPLPPPALYDLLIVFSDLQDSREDKESALIEVPPFTSGKDGMLV